jgi:LacI family transcriptional regulator
VRYTWERIHLGETLQVGSQNKMRKGTGSLLEIARRCEVSQSTVSRVLNNSNHGRFSVSPEVRAKILGVAAALNYRPNMAARNLTVSKTHLVAVLGLSEFWSDHVGPIEEAVGAVAKSLDSAGYELCIQIMSPRHGPFDLPPLRVDGILAVAPQSLALLEPLEQSRIPYVSMDGVVGPGGAQVLPGDADGTLKALQHLTGLGHRRIAYFDNPDSTDTHLSVFVRREAFQRHSRELGVESPILSLPRLGSSQAWGPIYEPFLRQAVIQGHATAVLAYSHFGALSLIRKAHDMGLSIPGDFSLVCFNNEPALELAIPSVTAVDVPSVTMGKIAADLLLRQMESKNTIEPESVLLTETLIPRESTAAPRQSP